MFGGKKTELPENVKGRCVVTYGHAAWPPCIVCSCAVEYHHNSVTASFGAAKLPGIVVLLWPGFGVDQNALR